MCECMMFPDNVEEFMDSYKIVDTEHVYTNGTEMVPIFRMKQWFEHRPERKTGRWIPCSERLPKDGERVLATHLGGLNPDRQVIEHIYKNGEFTLGWDMDMNMDSPTFGQRYMGKVIAWMPLPEAYQEG